MFCGVFVLGAITAADMRADEAHTKRYPGVSCFDAVFTTADIVCLYVFDLRGVGAIYFSHEGSMTD